MTCEGCSGAVERVLGKLKGNLEYLFYEQKLQVILWTLSSSLVYMSYPNSLPYVFNHLNLLFFVINQLLLFQYPISF